MTLADPTTFFATPRNPLKSSSYRLAARQIAEPTDESVDNAANTLMAPRPTTPLAQRSTSSTSSVSDLRTPKASQAKESITPFSDNPIDSPSSYATASSDIIVPPLEGPLDYPNLSMKHETVEPSASHTEQSGLRSAAPLTEHTSFGSDRTEIASPSNVMADSKDKMSVHSRLWAIENMLNERLASIEDQVKKLKLKGGSGQELPPTPPDDATVSQSIEKLSLNKGKDESEISTPSQQKPTWSFKVVEEAKPWTPAAVRAMPALKDLPLAKQPLPMDSLKGFTRDFIVNYLGGSEWAPGMYYPATGAKLKQIGPMVNHKTYYIVDAVNEPFIPTQPGEHGAKIAAVMRPLNTDKMAFDVPLFASFDDAAEPKKYFYLGHYSQTRWSDRLDYDRAQEIVPVQVKQHWARLIADRDRPEWMKQELMTAIWPKPNYDGIIPGCDVSVGEGTDERGDDALTKAKMDMQEYLDDLAAWRKEAEEKVEGLTVEKVMGDFERADADGSPGLRFWWEYLQCVKFDRNFYYILVSALEGRAK